MRISDWSSDLCSSDLRSATSSGVRNLLSGTTASSGSTTKAVSPRLELIIEVVCRGRSEESRVGKECVSTCKSRWWPYHYKTTNIKTIHTINLKTYTKQTLELDNTHVTVYTIYP